MNSRSAGRKIRRWWKQAGMVALPDGNALMLDGKPLHTPQGRDMVVPGLRLAGYIVEEWSNAPDWFAPADMPFTRLANAAIDGRQAAIDPILGYVSSDLICYRADEPSDLVIRQQSAWDPVIEMYVREWGITIHTVTGIMPVDQPAEVISAMRSMLDGLDPFTLVALCEQATLTGSLLLAVASLQGWIESEEAWRLSLVDLEWQRDHWGTDTEDAARTVSMHNQFMQASRFISALRE